MTGPIDYEEIMYARNYGTRKAADGLRQTKTQSKRKKARREEMTV